MGRARKDGDPLGLTGTRLSFKHGAFYYRHQNGRWERLGTDLKIAKERAKIYNSPSNNFGTINYWLDQFILDCESRVKSKDLALRTLSDYKKDSVPLKVFFGDMLPEHLEAHHVQSYLKAGLEADRPVRANREKACLSSCISWMIRTDRTKLKVNPCMQKSGTRENSESKRDRYVTNEEYQAVYEAAGTQVRVLMELTYRTLQRPESDLIYWTPKVLGRDPHTGQRIITFEQGKTKTRLKIAMTENLERLIDRVTGAKPRMDQPLIHTRDDESYTYSGITSMLGKAINKVNKEREKRGLDKIPSFGFRDLKGKGATDMWLSGTPIEQIQLLCGHSDKATTERYIKARWNFTAQPNELAIK